MSDPIASIVEIADKEYYPLNVNIQQYFNCHHHFKVVLASTFLGNKDEAATLNDVKDLIGEEVKIKIEQEEGELLFIGFITEVDLCRKLGDSHDVILSGYSPTIKIENGLHCRTFEKKKTGEIVKNILSDFSELDAEINPKHEVELTYHTQYKETNYNFIARLADLFGEWFYYDGVKIHFGEHDQGEEFHLRLGESVGEYNISLRLSPANFTFLTYDYSANEVLKASSANAQVSGLDQYGDTALAASEKFFPKETIIPAIQWANAQKRMDDWMQYRKTAYATDMVMLSGDSNNPSIRIGTMIELRENDDTGVGKYRVTQVTHSIDGRGSYRNYFEAVPASVKAPPSNNSIDRPVAETQPAVVKDNADPDGLGRVRVQFHWQKNDDMTPWIRVAFPCAGSGDVYFVPEIDDEVMIGFEFENPNRPYVIGSVYHGKKKPVYFSDNNSIKAIRTKDGNRIILIDGDEGEIQILNKDDKNSITLSLKDDASITIKTTGTLAMEAKTIKMKAEELTADLEKTLTLKSGRNASIEAQQLASIKGMEAKLEGDMTAIIKGGMVMIN